MSITRKYRSFPHDPALPPLFKDGGVEWFPTLQVRLWRKHGKPSTRIVAIADTGSPLCLFDANYGRLIGLEIEKGPKHQITGVVAGPKLDAYFHNVSMSIEDNWTIEVVVGFVDGFNVGALLGRRGFFDTFWVRFDHSSIPPTLEIDKITKPN